MGRPISAKQAPRDVTDLQGLPSTSPQGAADACEPTGTASGLSSITNYLRGK